VNYVDAKRLGTLPTATGGIARLAYACARDVGTARPTDQRPRRSTRCPPADPVLNLAANALGDEFLGFQLARLPDLRELGLLFYDRTLSQDADLAARLRDRAGI
jgi:hypothetical protein